MSRPIIDLNFRPRLEVITGCMFSGKTEELISLLDQYRHARASVVLLRPEKDTRESETHFGRKFEGIYIPKDCTIGQLRDVLSEKKIEFDKTDVFGFDEGNFFEPEAFVSLCNDLYDEGKIIIVAGLDKTFAEIGYGPMPKLILAADVVDKRHAICVVCGSPYATRTQRLIDGKPASKDSPQDIVGDEKARETSVGVVTYEPRCRHCHKLD